MTTASIPIARETPRAPTQRRAGARTGINVGAAERWASLIGGAALALYGLSKRSMSGLLMAAAGGALLNRGATGHCPVYRRLGVDTARGRESHLGLPGIHPVEVEHAVTINRPRDELYDFWHHVENLPRVMTHLQSVTPLGEGRSHWVAKSPLGGTVEWDAIITDDRPNERIAWKSLDDSEIASSGQVRFTSAPGDRGTEVKVHLVYDAPAGKAGAKIAKLTGESADQQVREDLRHFKQMMESGEIPTTTGQPRGPDE